MNRMTHAGRKAMGVLLCATVLAACNPATMALSGDRATTRDIAATMIAAQDPVIEADRAAQCVGASATAEEADALIAAHTARNAEGQQDALTKILRKTNTQECLATVGVPDLL